ENLLRSTIRELRQVPVEVTIIASVPEVGVDVPSVLARQEFRGAHVDLSPRYSDFAKRQARAFQVLLDVAAEGIATIVYPHQILCDASSCSVVKGDYPLYSDNQHITAHGALLFAPMLSPFLTETAFQHK